MCPLTDSLALGRFVVSLTVRFLRRDEVLSLVGLSKSKMYALIKDSDFPPPRKIGSTSVWVETEIAAWQQKVIGA